MPEVLAGMYPLKPRHRRHNPEAIQGRFSIRDLLHSESARPQRNPSHLGKNVRV